MIRTIIWFAYFWISLVGLMPALFKVNKMTANEKLEFADQKARQWSSKLLKLAGCKVEIVGLENIPKDSAVLYVCNHQSNFDIPLTILHLPKTKGFIAKVELLKMPFVRDWMKHMKCIFMDRSDIRQQVKGISQGVQSLKEGQSMVIFPEGTRSPDGKVKAFKPGGLKLATKSGVPIVPVTIKGSKDIMKKGSLLIKPANVEIIISEPIWINKEMNKETVALTETVKAIIESHV
ncbi:1-acyl-sn-glycerol-3-phosphate acyltransferase [Fusibacter sp. 3D3]|uniref:lysophospholipid acyltransferase family protein n=1 Tax=Fusibacter sp. 3D3 TaxID=1048380 RepID=UPI0008538A3F|nr:lysophospholipid acyltransferase family protein [Fusibacter sp. 3D3]GAU78596.1 1-acyl-sn-glycerol-3-phosphate acyltransferase [Fusibacter sp. 3D3]